MPHATVPTPSAKNEAPAQDLMRTVEIDSVPLTFDITTVPDPPTVSFADDVESLFTEWYSSTKLVVMGRGIPIHHWDKFYMKKHKIKPHAWDSLRSTWHNWKVGGLLQAEREGVAKWPDSSS